MVIEFLGELLFVSFDIGVINFYLNGKGVLDVHTGFAKKGDDQGVPN